jgi:hypothetical protein
LNGLGSWFDRLVRNRMGGPAIAVTIISVSIFILAMARLAQGSWANRVSIVGFVLLCIGVLCLLITAMIVVVRWARRAMNE